MRIHADKNKKKIRVNPPNPLNPRSIFNSDGFFACRVGKKCRPYTWVCINIMGTCTTRGLRVEPAMTLGAGIAGRDEADTPAMTWAELS